MIVFSCNNVQVAFGAETVLNNISFVINEKDHIGIIGNNGAGKTTLVKLLLGYVDKSNGDVFRYPKLTQGYMAQNAGLESDNTVLNEFLVPFSDMILLENRIHSIENELKYTTNEPDILRLSQSLSKLYDDYVAKDGNTYRSRINSILAGLGFSEEMHNMPISTLSGGQKTRLALGRLLLKSPDVLILDEPTNHLDTESLEWLENYLKGYLGTLLIISHDRSFLDNTVTKTMLVEKNCVTIYNAPYSKYLELREADKDYRERQYKQQQKEITKIKDFIAMQKRWNQERNYVTIASWEKKLDHMDLVEKVDSETSAAEISFDISTPSGNDVLFVNNLGFSYTDKPLFRDLSFNVYKGDRIFIKGPNGCGKSTLLNILTGKQDGYSGNFRFITGANWSFYTQNMIDLNEENTVLEEIWEYANRDRSTINYYTPMQLRNALAAFNFTGEDVFKKISILSGGERARIALLKIIYNKSNLLILDEPTNHLDIQTREALETALQNYKGTLIAISHDRYFVNKLCNKIVDITPNCDIEKKDKVVTESKNSYIQTKEEKAIKKRRESLKIKLELDIEKFELRLNEIDTTLSDETTVSNYALISQLYKEKEEISNQLDTSMNEYLLLLDEI